MKRNVLGFLTSVILSASALAQALSGRQVQVEQLGTALPTPMVPFASRAPSLPGSSRLTLRYEGGTLDDQKQRLSRYGNGHLFTTILRTGWATLWLQLEQEYLDKNSDANPEPAG